MRPLIFVLFLIAAVTFSACSSHVQTTSGAKYLAAYAESANDPKRKGAKRITDAVVRKAAAVEPILRFPARLGLARMEGGRLTGIPQSEAALWHDLARKNRHLGNFVPISPIIAAFTTSVVGAKRNNPGCRYRGCDAVDVVSKIRLGAARQHVDAVLIYEVGSNSSKENTFLAFADLTIIGGAILPTRSIKAQGVAQALLLDVRNGYPYGTASAEADLSSLSISWGSDERQASLREKASLKVVTNLLPEVETMFRKLWSRRARRS